MGHDCPIYVPLLIQLIPRNKSSIAVCSLIIVVVGGVKRYMCSGKAMASKRTALDPFNVAKKAKCQVTIATGKKWRTQYNCEYRSLTWRKYDVDD